ncbi:jg8865 [Pararge aegeria aegeria]|uniref:Jg8865 protein n=1 Tax=Pararge aegeria aegeria TaxID=348720 RepID=A0A8S4R9N2_9NEOP|nr:jg8865 [Pararge aegeria aegeria]
MNSVEEWVSAGGLSMRRLTLYESHLIEAANFNQLGPWKLELPSNWRTPEAVIAKLVGLSGGPMRIQARTSYVRFKPIKYHLLQRSRITS